MTNFTKFFERKLRGKFSRREDIVINTDMELGVIEFLTQHSAKLIEIIPFTAKRPTNTKYEIGGTHVAEYVRGKIVDMRTKREFDIEIKLTKLAVSIKPSSPLPVNTPLQLLVEYNIKDHVDNFYNFKVLEHSTDIFDYKTDIILKNVSMYKLVDFPIEIDLPKAPKDNYIAALQREFKVKSERLVGFNFRKKSSGGNEKEKILSLGKIGVAEKLLREYIRKKNEYIQLLKDKIESNLEIFGGMSYEDLIKTPFALNEEDQTSKGAISTPPYFNDTTDKLKILFKVTLGVNETAKYTLISYADTLDELRKSAQMVFLEKKSRRTKTKKRRRKKR